MPDGKLKELEEKLTTLEENSDEYKVISEQIEELKKTSSTDNSDNTRTYSKDEFESVVQQRQELKRKLKSMEKQVEEFGSLKTNYESIKSELDNFKSLKEELEELKKKSEEEELSKKSEAEREVILARKEFESFKDKITKQLEEESKKFTSLSEEKKALENKVRDLNNVTLEVSIRDAASKYKAVSPSQIVRLLKNDFIFDDTVGEFIVPKYKDVRGEKVISDWDDIDTYVKKFLEEEVNGNLVKADEKSGIEFNTSQSRSKTSSKVKIKQSDDSKLTPAQLDEKLTQWAKERGFEKDFAIELYNVHKESLFTR